ncbi:hypothetical protein CEP50_10820 [Actinopolyspora mortivallis]|uniref:Uncharacterized protein n=1 Tax=Actinopolyspora mortivallis TaxID=33906 RepID=A0A2T0GW30_ACTMO|nr:hypothetical protein CEP50_10820 [Actinopolyspora mortivallis]
MVAAVATAAETCRGVSVSEEIDVPAISLFTALIAARSRLVRASENGRITWRRVHLVPGSWVRAEPDERCLRRSAGPGTPIFGKIGTTSVADAGVVDELLGSG